MTMQTTIPGLKAGHRMITPVCRQNRTITGAFLTAVDDLQKLYDKYARAEGNEDVTWHLVLVREDGDKAVEALEKANDRHKD